MNSFPRLLVESAIHTDLPYWFTICKIYIERNMVNMQGRFKEKWFFSFVKFSCAEASKLVCSIAKKKKKKTIKLGDTTFLPLKWQHISFWRALQNAKYKLTWFYGKTLDESNKECLTCDIMQCYETLIKSTKYFCEVFLIIILTKKISLAEFISGCYRATLWPEKYFYSKSIAC